MELLSGQTELPTLPLWRCALCTQVWQFRMALGPFQCLQRMLHYCTWGLPLAWHVLQSTLLTLESFWKKKLLQTASKNSPISHKIPWLCPKFQFSPTGKSLLNFPGFPVWVGALYICKSIFLNMATKWWPKWGSLLGIGLIQMHNCARYEACTYDSFEQWVKNLHINGHLSPLVAKLVKRLLVYTSHICPLQIEKWKVLVNYRVCCMFFWDFPSSTNDVTWWP